MKRIKSDITIRGDRIAYIYYTSERLTRASAHIHTSHYCIIEWKNMLPHEIISSSPFYFFLGWKHTHTHTRVVYMKVFENLCIIASNRESGGGRKILIWHLNFKCGLVDVTLRWNIQRSFFITHHFFLFVPHRRFFPSSSCSLSRSHVYLLKSNNPAMIRCSHVAIRCYICLNMFNSTMWVRFTFNTTLLRM